MGDIADMMLEGVLCQVCGSYLGEIPEDGESEVVELIPDGFPQTCESCQN